MESLHHSTGAPLVDPFAIRSTSNIFNSLLVNPLIAAGLGYACGKVCQIDAGLMAKIFGVWCLAKELFMTTANALFGDRGGLKSRAIIIFADAAAGSGFIMALRHENIIAKKGTIILATIQTISSLFLLSQYRRP